MRYENPGYVAPDDRDDDTTDLQKTEFIGCLGDKKEPPIYVDPASVMQTFFSKAEVFLDSYLVTKHTELEGSGALYAHINRTFMTNLERKRQYGHNFFLNHSGKMVSADMTNISPDLKYAVEMANFKNKTDPQGKVLNGNYEGYFLLGQNRSSILNKLQGQKARRENPLIPPGTRIHVRLYRQQPRQDGGLGRLTTDKKYFVETAEDEKNFPEIKIEIQSIFLGLETHQLDLAAAAKAEKRLSSKAVLKFFTDLVKISYSNLSPGVQISQQTFDLPVGTKVAVVGFVQANQIWLNTQLHKGMSPKTTFPKNLEKMDFELNGNPVTFAGGLNEIWGDHAPCHPWSFLYFNYLREKGLVDDDYSSFFPPSGFSYTQMILLDLTSHTFTKPGQLAVKSTFNAAVSPKNTYTFVCTIGQGVVERNSQKEWNVAVIP